MAASEVSAWGGFVVCLPACLPALASCLHPEPGDPEGLLLRAGHLRHSHGWASPSYPQLGISVTPRAGHGVGAVTSVGPASWTDGQTHLVSIPLPTERALPPIPGGGSQGDKEEAAEERV